MFERILIANRGEIACRVLRTARRLGVRTVAVYSDADAQARHVRLADEAVRIGPAPASESYLHAERIIEACRRTGAQAVHPGYGFLSENAPFAQALADAGIAFVGPPPAAIRAMGLKSESKRLMAAAGLALIPGYHGDEQDAAWLCQQADAIGYPVLIKASAGGGGKGMRAVWKRADFEPALRACQREAAASFGNDRVLIEAYLQQPRHIEIQIFADNHGNCVSLFERDCSVQRRHQKVLEEAPAPGLSPEQRTAMGNAAIAAARAVGYVGAGTVEFIVDQSGHFYFMEMNTRLQVEHPVTEMITGLDLVEWQLRVAAGEALPLTAEALALRGHAIEARVYAEDPERDFLPSSGRLIHLHLPEQSAQLRVDSGVDPGDDISPHYDPMIAKLIVWGEDREAARVRLAQALAQFHLVGVADNLQFLSRLTACPSFAAARLDTSLIEREREVLFAPRPLPTPEVWLVAALAEFAREREADARLREQGRGDDPHSPWRLRDGWRLNQVARRHMHFRAGDTQVSVTLTDDGSGLVLSIGDHHWPAQVLALPGGELTLSLSDRRFTASVIAVDDQRHVFLFGQCHLVHAVDPLRRTDVHAPSEGGLTAPMPGKVIALAAKAGDRVAKGAPLLILEAMKMEHTLIAPSDGVITAYRCAPGERIAEGALLVDFDAQV